MPQLIFRPVVVDGKAYVVLLDELLDARKSTRRRVSSDDHPYSRSLAVLELIADVSVFIFIEVDRSRGMQLNTRCMVVFDRFRLLYRIHREMIFNILGIQREHVELLHIANQRVRLKLRKV